MKDDHQGQKLIGDGMMRMYYLKTEIHADHFWNGLYGVPMHSLSESSGWKSTRLEKTLDLLGNPQKNFGRVLRPIKFRDDCEDERTITHSWMQAITDMAGLITVSESGVGVV
jgi:hypothetical protein